jgi:hypothetical protein
MDDEADTMSPFSGRFADPLQLHHDDTHAG